MPFTVTEPHPTVRAHAYTHSGRGGAGNTFRAPVTTPATGVPTLAKIPSASSASTAHTSTRFYAGRGGAGNAHPVSERRELSLDDEYAHAAAVAKKATAGHVGRGGAGNVFFSGFKSSSPAKSFSSNRKASDASSASSDSVNSTESRKSGFWGRMHR